MVSIKTYAKHIRKISLFSCYLFNLIFYQLPNFGLLINFRAHLLQVCTYINMIEWYVWFVSSCTYLYSDIMYLESKQFCLWYDVRISYIFYHQSIALSYLLLLMHLAYDIYIPYKYSTSMLIWFSTVWRYLLEEESFTVYYPFNASIFRKQTINS